MKSIAGAAQLDCPLDVRGDHDHSGRQLSGVRFDARVVVVNGSTVVEDHSGRDSAPADRQEVQFDDSGAARTPRTGRRRSGGWRRRPRWPGRGPLRPSASGAGRRTRPGPPPDRRTGLERDRAGRLRAADLAPDLVALLLVQSAEIASRSPCPAPASGPGRRLPARGSRASSRAARSTRRRRRGRRWPDRRRAAGAGR